MAKKLENWLAPFLALFVVIAFVIGVVIIYSHHQKRFETAKSQVIAESIAEDLNREIQVRVAMFTALSELKPSSKNLIVLAEALIKHYPYLYAINLVSPTGVIEFVYPKEKNKLALGQNLLQRQDVSGYLLAAKNTKTPNMSHRILTYQQIYAFVLYIPLFNSENRFLGWLNAVVDFDDWLKDYIARTSMQNTNIKINWLQPIKAELEFGPPPVTPIYNFTYQVLNQKLGIDIGFSKGHLDLLKDRTYFFLLLTGGFLLLLTSALMVKLNLAKIRLSNMNFNLNIKNSLLSSLTHDFSTPLTVLGMTLRLGFKQNPDAFPEKQQNYCMKALKSLEEILTSARHMHAQGMGLSTFKNKPTSLTYAFQEALMLIEDQVQLKKVKIEATLISHNLMVQSDPMTLSNNVLRNVLTNALKFSPPGGEVKVHFQEFGDDIHVILDDSGQGFNEDQFSYFRKFSILSTTPGTWGETGTGLGLFQVKNFMKSYGGDCLLENNESGGARVILIFKKARVTEELNEEKSTYSELA